MGQMNLLKANYTGKVGQTVGAKWKDKSTLRTFTKPSNPNTEAQREVRNGFTQMTKFIALFADQIKYLSALNTAGMSVKNAIMKINKDLIKEETIDFLDLEVSKGGLQTPNTVTAAYDATSGKVSFTWAKPTATNFTANAVAVMVVVDQADKVALVSTKAYDAESGDMTIGANLAGDKIAYLYFLDKRGSSKVGSVSASVAVTTAP